MKTNTSLIFADRTSVEQVEEGTDLAPKFDQNGVIPCITQHAESREILMFAFMNEEALRLTIETRLAHYWSRSRQKLWKKGETSGMTQQVQRMLKCHEGGRVATHAPCDNRTQAARSHDEDIGIAMHLGKLDGLKDWQAVGAAVPAPEASQ